MAARDLSVGCGGFKGSLGPRRRSRSLTPPGLSTATKPTASTEATPSPPLRPMIALKRLPRTVGLRVYAPRRQSMLAIRPRQRRFYG